MTDDLAYSIVSSDGTHLAFWRRGEGPPLLLVHGAIADHTTTWRFVLPELARHFAVYVMDRRGRGGSGDAGSHDLQREVDDVVAVIDAVADAAGAPVAVVGHSFGGLCALEAARLTTKVGRLILYEGVSRRGADGCPPAVVDRLDALLAAGDADGLLVAVLRHVVEMRPEDIAMLRAQPDAWAVRLRNAPTVPRELRAASAYVFDPARYRGIRTPVLLLVGGDSPPRERDDAIAVARALPDARVVELAGEQHVAMYTAPDLFVREVVHFLEA